MTIANNFLRPTWRLFAPRWVRDVIWRYRNRALLAVGTRQAAFIDRERERLFLTIAELARVNRPADGVYMEFGCNTARSMRLAWRHFGHLGWNFIAFDSFEGFPEISPIDRLELWKKGSAAMDEGLFVRKVLSAGMPKERLQIVRGFYRDSLTAALADSLPGKAAVAYVDCDLYESTKDVLAFLPPFIKVGTIIVLDDWDCFWSDPERGQRRAWKEFLTRHPNANFEEVCRIPLSIAFVCTKF